ncbi:MAG: hypothetical protein LIO95_10805, partial [Clostridiales bacterium]|nr:hypothetical protein [Clostridiales bacterium]
WPLPCGKDHLKQILFRFFSVYLTGGISPAPVRAFFLLWRKYKPMKLPRLFLPGESTPEARSQWREKGFFRTCMNIVKNIAFQLKNYIVKCWRCW